MYCVGLFEVSFKHTSRKETFLDTVIEYSVLDHVKELQLNFKEIIAYLCEKRSIYFRDVKCGVQ